MAELRRQALWRRLDAIIVENRFTISVFFPLNGIVLLLASAEGVLPGWLSFNAALILLGTVVMRSPLIVGVAPVVTRRAAVAIGALAAYAYTIEYVGITTGWPYGAFHYGVALGPMLGGIPVGLPVFFIPLVMNAYLLWVLLLGDRIGDRRVRILTIFATVMAMDLVLDPGAVGLGFWTYLAGGTYYDVPVSNFLGWLLSAAVAIVVLDWGFDHHRLAARLRACPFILDDLVSFVILWGGINLYFGHIVPVLIAVVLAVALVRAERFDTGLFTVRAPAVR
jgi:carotene biosynthesis associated membrane protein